MMQSQWLDKTRQDAEIRLGCLTGFGGGNFAGQVFDKDGLSPTLTDMQGGGRQPHIVEIQRIICAMRGRETTCLHPKRTEYGKEIRKAYENHEIEEQRKNMQQLEPRTDGLTNTITTVQKDNLVLETQAIIYDDYNSTVCQNQDVVFTATPNFGHSALRNGVKVIKIRQATKEGFIECPIGGVFDSSYPDSKLRRGRVQGNGQISQTLTTENIPSVIELGDPDFYNFLYEIDGEIYLIRIRKLMPLECWRLMNFTDEDFHKAEKVVSNTQLYKQAGNSIVKSVLMALFSQLGISGVKKWNDMTDDERYNLIYKE